MTENNDMPLRTMEEDRAEMLNMFRSSVTEREQVGNLLESSSMWMNARANAPYFKNHRHLMREYGFKLQDIKSVVNRLYDENAALKARIQALEKSNG